MYRRADSRRLTLATEEIFCITNPSSVRGDPDLCALWALHLVCCFSIFSSPQHLRNILAGFLPPPLYIENQMTHPSHGSRLFAVFWGKQEGHPAAGGGLGEPWGAWTGRHNPEQGKMSPSLKWGGWQPGGASLSKFCDPLSWPRANIGIFTWQLIKRRSASHPPQWGGPWPPMRARPNDRLSHIYPSPARSARLEKITSKPTPKCKFGHFFSFGKDCQKIKISVESVRKKNLTFLEDGESINQ